jgi:dephospho-CoA kinase
VGPVFVYSLGVLIGLTGGIGSGKSTVARRLVELGAVEIDADLLAREVVAPGSEGLSEVAKRFGEDLISTDGSLYRPLLAQRAFASEQDRKDLEGILHPRIQKLSRERIAAESGLVIYTIPLLVETASTLPFDKIITVSAPEDIRIARLVESRGMSVEEATARIKAQATDAMREAVADYVIHSDCSMEELMNQVDKIYAQVAQ